jgi:RecB family exonuclease
MQNSHTRSSTFRRCRRRYYWQYVLGYRQPPSPGQLTGSVGHECLAYFYKNGADEKAARQAELLAIELVEKKGGSDTNLNDVGMALKRYWPLALKDHFEVLAVEHKFELQIGTHRHIGFIDAVVRAPDGVVYAMEHKFHKQVSVEHLSNDPQCSTYLLGGQEFGVQAVLYNVIRVTHGPKAKDQPVVRQVATRSDEYLQRFAREVEIQTDEQDHFERLEPQRRAELAYPNPTKDCSWDCTFYAACQEFSYDGTTSILQTFPRSFRRGPAAG